MKTERIYNCETGKTMEMVPADVALRLYRALEVFAGLGCFDYATIEELEEARDALAAADGEYSDGYR